MGRVSGCPPPASPPSFQPPPDRVGVERAAGYRDARTPYPPARQPRQVEEPGYWRSRASASDSSSIVLAHIQHVLPVVEAINGVELEHKMPLKIEVQARVVHVQVSEDRPSTLGKQLGAIHLQFTVRLWPAEPNRG